MDTPTRHKSNEEIKEDSTTLEVPDNRRNQSHVVTNEDEFVNDFLANAYTD